MAGKRKKTAGSSRRRAAATSDILGNRPLQPRVRVKWKKYHNMLMVARDYLTNQQRDLVETANEDQPAFSLHMADAATDNFDRDFLLSRASSEQEALNEINEALARIHDGTYGTCELTGKPIEPDRLEAIPWTRFSKAAEKELESRGSIRRTKLASRQPMPQGIESSNEARGSTEDEQFQQE